MSNDRARLDDAIALIESPAQRFAAALAPLRGIARILVTGAHPDDEMSTLLAALVRRDGARVAYACATRGQGGQNAIGLERGAMLGALRTKEMELAAERLGICLYWLSEASGDSIVDFGFAKTAEATFARWNRARVLDRLVAVIRAEKPDIVWPTFLDVPGQHGHHRAVTQATIEAVRRAADPDWPAPGAAAWRVAKLYLPAWSGGGGTYDDALPPPNASVVYDAGGIDEATGLTYAQFAECSRAAHASQGMGRWVERGPALYPLHLLHRESGTRGASDRAVDERATSTRGEAERDGHERSIFDGLPRRLTDIAHGADAETTRVLDAAQRALDAVRAAAPDAARVAESAEAADEAIAAALTAIPEPMRDAHGHRLIALRDSLAPLRRPPRMRGTGAATRRQGESPDTASLEPPPPSRAATAPSLRLEPDALVLNRQAARAPLRVDLTLEPSSSDRVTVELDLPPGWRAESLPATLTVAPDAPTRVATALVPPADLACGLHDIAARLDGVPATSVQRSHHAHVGEVTLATPSVLRLRIVDIALPEGARIAYVGGGGDRVDHWLMRLGLDVTSVGPEAFPGIDLSRFATLVVGIFALRTRPDLAADLARVHRWVRAGGHLVTLYHRPIDNWHEHASAPARLAIGSPSLRWRVCDPAAPVRVLDPAHRLLTRPNRIGPDDWSGWAKERGLYFASNWDPTYTPLVEMNDPGDPPLAGALLTGRFGRGRHTHTSLVLHHQLEQMVPGAMRLMANLMQPS
ncbi:MAG: PIG-L family deacetylase [Alphaproteobacteria bacterium]|nr:PIG-L family deacetylase [Alphaproteobacteria bacterium]